MGHDEDQFADWLMVNLGIPMALVVLAALAPLSLVGLAGLVILVYAGTLKEKNPAGRKSSLVGEA